MARESASEGTVLRAEFSRKFPMQNCARESSDEFRKRCDGEEAALSAFDLKEDDFQLPRRLRTLHPSYAVSYHPPYFAFLLVSIVFYSFGI